MLPELGDRYGVESLGVFGSVARGDAGAASDVDVLIAFRKGVRYTMMTLTDVKDRLESVIDRRVDLVTDHDGLRPRFRAAVSRDLIRVA